MKLVNIGHLVGFTVGRTYELKSFPMMSYWVRSIEDDNGKDRKLSDFTIEAYFEEVNS